MYEYECNEYGKKFNHKTKFDSHINKKTQCKPLSAKQKLKRIINFIIIVKYVIKYLDDQITYILIINVTVM